MTQYISTSTKNLLERRENCFHWRGVDFPGLVDEATNALYDHPEHSFNKHIGMRTALEQGLIILVLAEVSDYKTEDKGKKIPVDILRAWFYPTLMGVFPFAGATAI